MHLPNRDDSPPVIVILNGGEAAVRDRTTARGFDVVDGNSLGAGSVPVRLWEYSLN